MGFSKTELGQEVLKTRSMPLTPRQRAILIMADGTKDGSQLLTMTAGMGATVEDLTDLVMRGLLVSQGHGASTAAAAPAPAPVRHAPAATQGPPSQLDSIADGAHVDVRTSDFGDSVPQAAAPKVPDYKTAYLAGVALTSELGFKGFRLNMAMESAADVEAIRDLRPKILDALISKHGESKARDLMRDFDRALGLR